MTSNNQPRTTTARSGAWPWLLVAAGTLLLFANFGWLGWTTLIGYATLLPLLLVAIGLDIVLRGRYRLLVVIGTIAAAALLIATEPRWGAGALSGTQTIAHELAGARSAEVSLSTGVSRLTVRGSARSDLIVEGSIQPRRGERIDRSFSTTGGVARFSATSSRKAFSGMFGVQGGTWDLLLSGRVPVALRVDTGVGDATLDLSELNLERLSVDTGVGTAVVTLPDSGRFDAEVNSGVGAVTIRLPQGMAARITVDSGIGAVSVPAGFTREGEVYVSPGFATATDRVELHVDSGVGAVDVVAIR